MKFPLRRFIPLLVLVALVSAFWLGGGNVTSCEGGCFGPACATPAAH